MFTVRSPGYYSFLLFKWSKTQSRRTLSKSTTCAWKSKKTRCLPQKEKRWASHCKGHICKNHVKRKNGFTLVFFYPIHLIHSSNLEVISNFLVLYKMLWITQHFLKKIRWKCLWKTSCARNQINFIWEESTRYLMNGKRWFKLMMNIPLIQINSFINY